MTDVLLGMGVAVLFICLLLLGVILLLLTKVMNGVQRILDFAGASEPEDDEPVEQEQVVAPGSVPMPPRLRDKLLPQPPSTDLTNGTFGGRKPWVPPSDEPPAA